MAPKQSSKHSKHQTGKGGSQSTAQAKRTAVELTAASEASVRSILQVRVDALLLSVWPAALAAVCRFQYTPLSASQSGWSALTLSTNQLAIHRTVAGFPPLSQQLPTDAVLPSSLQPPTPHQELEASSSQSQQQPAAAPAASAKQLQRQYAGTYSRLVEYGFAAQQVQAALRALPLGACAGVEAALDWLCLNLPQNQLPRRFAGATRGGGPGAGGVAVKVRVGLLLGHASAGFCRWPWVYLGSAAANQKQHQVRLQSSSSSSSTAISS